MILASLPEHPGRITFVEGASQTVDDAATVPDSIRFAPDGNGQLVPVVRIVIVTFGDQRAIRAYGVEGALLQSTVQVRGKSAGTTPW